MPPKGNCRKGTFWCWTLHEFVDNNGGTNWTAVDTSLQNAVNERTLRYVIFQAELCPTTNRKHLQGYLECGQQRTMRQVKAMIGDDRVHLEIRMSNTAEAAITYCRKDESCIRNDDGTPLMRREYGSVSKGSGYRTDLEVMVLPVLDDIRQGTAISVLRNKYPTEFLLHNNYFKEVAAQLKRDNAPKWRKTV